MPSSGLPKPTLSPRDPHYLVDLLSKLSDDPKPSHQLSPLQSIGPTTPPARSPLETTVPTPSSESATSATPIPLLPFHKPSFPDSKPTETNQMSSISSGNLADSSSSSSDEEVELARESPSLEPPYRRDLLKTIMKSAQGLDQKLEELAIAAGVAGPMKQEKQRNRDKTPDPSSPVETDPFRTPQRPPPNSTPPPAPRKLAPEASRKPGPSRLFVEDSDSDDGFSTDGGLFDSPTRPNTGPIQPLPIDGVKPQAKIGKNVRRRLFTEELKDREQDAQEDDWGNGNWSLRNAQQDKEVKKEHVRMPSEGVRRTLFHPEVSVVEGSVSPLHLDENESRSEERSGEDRKKEERMESTVTLADETVEKKEEEEWKGVGDFESWPSKRDRTKSTLSYHAPLIVSPRTRQPTIQDSDTDSLPPSPTLPALKPSHGFPLPGLALSNQVELYSAPSVPTRSIGSPKGPRPFPFPMSPIASATILTPSNKKELVQRVETPGEPQNLGIKEEEWVTEPPPRTASLFASIFVAPGAPETSKMPETESKSLEQRDKESSRASSEVEPPKEPSKAKEAPHGPLVPPIFGPGSVVQSPVSQVRESDRPLLSTQTNGSAESMSLHGGRREGETAKESKKFWGFWKKKK